MGLKDHQIAKLTNDIRDILLIKMSHIRFPDSLREIISSEVNNSLEGMNARIDHPKLNGCDENGCEIDKAL